MSAAEKQATGTIVGFDLTVADADPIRDFYAAVVGWLPESFAMGDYSDYFMKSGRFSCGSATLRRRPLVRGLGASGPSFDPW